MATTLLQLVTDDRAGFHQSTLIELFGYLEDHTQLFNNNPLCVPGSAIWTIIEIVSGLYFIRQDSIRPALVLLGSALHRYPGLAAACVEEGYSVNNDSRIISRQTPLTQREPMYPAEHTRKTALAILSASPEDVIDISSADLVRLQTIIRSNVVIIPRMNEKPPRDITLFPADFPMVEPVIIRSAFLRAANAQVPPSGLLIMREVRPAIIRWMASRRAPDREILLPLCGSTDGDSHDLDLINLLELLCELNIVI